MTDTTDKPTANGLTRYGVKWRGPTEPICEPMDDGTWVAFAEVDALLAELQPLAEIGRLALEWGREKAAQGPSSGERWVAFLDVMDAYLAAQRETEEKP